MIRNTPLIQTDANQQPIIDVSDLKINFNAIVSFADPSAHVGLILQKSKIQKKMNKKL